jgi:hypothetical protein
MYSTFSTQFLTVLDGRQLESGPMSQKGQNTATSSCLPTHHLRHSFNGGLVQIACAAQASRHFPWRPRAVARREALGQAFGRDFASFSSSIPDEDDS